MFKLIKEILKSPRFTKYITILKEKNYFNDNIEKKLNKYKIPYDTINIDSKKIDSNLGVIFDKTTFNIIIYMLLFPNIKFIFLLNSQSINIDLINQLQATIFRKLFEKNNIYYFLQMNDINNNYNLTLISKKRNILKYNNFANLLLEFYNLDFISEKKFKK